MSVTSALPFKVGQLAESKSFAVGFRSAWFRCEIKKISTKKGHLSYLLEFIDYPDEPKRWTEVYQKSLGKGNQDARDLMVRPSYPRVYRESDIPDPNSISEPALVVGGAWRVGDHVDLLHSDCFWTGRVVSFLEDDKVTVALPDPPAGEGQISDGFCNDLRPSLDWSPEQGWTVPFSKESGRYCARLILPSFEGKSPERNHADNSPVGSSLKMLSGVSHDDAGYSEEELKLKSTGNLKVDCSKENSFISSSDPESVGPRSKKMKASDVEQLSEVDSALDSYVMNLEELANKVKWLKGVLQYGFHGSNNVKSSWEFLEIDRPASPKQ